MLADDDPAHALRFDKRTWHILPAGLTDGLEPGQGVRLGSV